MTRLIAILVALMAALPVQSQTVRVTSGEHDGFTRLALELPAAQDWQLGRTTDGYELRLPDPVPGYDLSGVFEVIGRSRLASIWADPETGALRLGIACACHAIPFEFRPEIIVIDLRDGPPPKDSSFERALDGSGLPPIVAAAPIRPRARPGPVGDLPFDWRDVALGNRWSDPGMTSAPAPASREPLPVAPGTITDPSLSPLRDQLLRQFSLGASQGLIDVAPLLPGQRDPQTAGPPAGEALTEQVRVTSSPGIEVRPGPTAPADIGTEGAICVDDARIDVATWGDGTPVADQMAAAMQGMVGEFDRPLPEGVARMVRLQLYLGFGAEVRMGLDAFPTEQPDAALWRSLAWLVDGQTDADGPFAGQEGCDGLAALWAAFAAPDLSPADMNSAAVLRGFSALPVHLRRHLGPALAERFLAAGDSVTARALRDALQRAPGDAGPEAALLDASLAEAEGDVTTAELQLQDMIDTPGPGTPDALLALVDLRAAEFQPVTAAEALAVEGLAQEIASGEDAPRYQRALASAHALSGDFRRAFAALDGTPATGPEVWAIFARLGPDSAILDAAILPADAALPETDDATRRTLAERLMALGFGTDALRWGAGLGDPILLAQAELTRLDPAAALRALAGQDAAATAPLRAEALSRLGEGAAAAQALADSGQTDAQRRADAWARDWPTLADAGDDAWQAAAQTLLPTNAGSSGTLADGRALLDKSNTTRAALSALLDTVPTVDGP